MAEQTNTQNQRSSSKSNGKWNKSSQGSSMQAGRGISNESEGGVQEKIMDTARNAYENVSEKASDYVDRASDYFTGFNANPGTFIRNYPVQAAIGGVVIGFLLGAAVCRRSID